MKREYINISSLDDDEDGDDDCTELDRICCVVHLLYKNTIESLDPFLDFVRVHSQIVGEFVAISCAAKECGAGLVWCAHNLIGGHVDGGGVRRKGRLETGH